MVVAFSSWMMSDAVTEDRNNANAPVVSKRILIEQERGARREERSMGAGQA